MEVFINITSIETTIYSEIIIARRDKVHAYRAKIQSRFSRKQSLKRKIVILYFRLLFSRRITPFPLVPPVTNHPVYRSSVLALNFKKFQKLNTLVCEYILTLTPNYLFYYLFYYYYLLLFIKLYHLLSSTWNFLIIFL